MHMLNSISILIPIVFIFTDAKFSITCLARYCLGVMSVVSTLDETITIP